MGVTGVEVIDVEVTEVESVGDTHIASEADSASFRAALFPDRGFCQTGTWSAQFCPAKQRKESVDGMQGVPLCVDQQMQLPAPATPS